MVPSDAKCTGMCEGEGFTRTQLPSACQQCCFVLVNVPSQCNPPQAANPSTPGLTTHTGFIMMAIAVAAALLVLLLEVVAGCIRKKQVATRAQKAFLATPLLVSPPGGDTRTFFGPQV